MTNTTPHTATPAIVLFGLDGQGRPLAATFAADQTALALKAATSLKLQTLKIETAEQTDLALCSPRCWLAGLSGLPHRRHDGGSAASPP